MKVFISGLIYRLQRRGGVSRIFNEIIPRIASNKDVDEFTFIAPRKSMQPFPEFEKGHIEYNSPSFCSWLKPELCARCTMRFYEQIVTPMRLKGDAQSILHLSYYLFPFFWKGKIVVEVYDLIYEFFYKDYPELFGGITNNRFRSMKRKAIERADATICISEQSRRDVCEMYNVDVSKVYCVYPAHSPVFRLLEDKEKLEVDKIDSSFILYVGTRVAYKNFRLLLKAFSSLKKNKDLLLVVIGPEWSDEEKCLIKELALTDKVLLKTGVDDETLCTIYNKALAFIFPSLYEGFGIPLLEAMACGCPVVASDIPTSREVALDVALFFDPFDEYSLIQKIEEAILLERRGKRVIAGLKRAQDFSWDRTAAEIVKIYKSVLK